MNTQHQHSEAQETILKESVISIHWGSRLVSKDSNIPSMSEWPKPRLLEALFKNNITAPVGTSHEKLLALFLENIHIEHTPADPSNSSIPRKATEKRKQC